jgi:hypothetical protein
MVQGNVKSNFVNLGDQLYGTKKRTRKSCLVNIEVEVIRFSLAWNGIGASSELLQNFWPDIINFEDPAINGFNQPASML